MSKFLKGFILIPLLGIVVMSVLLMTDSIDSDGKISLPKKDSNKNSNASFYNSKWSTGNGGYAIEIRESGSCLSYSGIYTNGEKRKYGGCSVTVDKKAGTATIKWTYQKCYKSYYNTWTEVYGESCSPENSIYHPEYKIESHSDVVTVHSNDEEFWLNNINFKYAGPLTTE